MQLARSMSRSFRIRRTVRLRLTAMFTVLFVLAGAALLAITSGLVVAGLFVANASHELRTPLTTMRALLDVAMAKPEPPPVQTVMLAGRLRVTIVLPLAPATALTGAPA